MALMRWKGTDAVKERVKFWLEWETRWGAGEGVLNFSALCREFGVSRQVGYDWLGRYRATKRDLEGREDAVEPAADEPVQGLGRPRGLHRCGAQASSYPTEARCNASST